MVMTVMGAYVLSRRDFMFRKPLTMMFVFTMYFTGGTIPNFILVKSLGLLNTRWALILPVAIGTWNMQDAIDITASEYEVFLTKPVPEWITE